jgi:beta-glucosidase
MRERNSMTIAGRLRAGLSVPILIAALAASGHAALAAPAEPAGTTHPDLWPAAHSPAAITDAKTEARITALMAQMSVEEKVGQIVQGDISSIKPEDLRTYPLGSVLAGGNSGPGGDDRASAQTWLEMIRTFHSIALEKRTGHTPIPVMFGLDAVHGDNNIPGATVFPHNIGLGAARDPELMGEIGKATSEETAVIGADWLFGPTIAVPQDTRWGRAYEGYGENPEIVRAYAPAMVEGVQGAMTKPGPIAAGRVAASIKHFLGDGGTTGGHDQGDAALSEAELIRVHAQGYPPAVDAGALTVMVSFSSWNGVKNTGNKGLLTDVLKGRMGFEGFLVGDWNAQAQVPGCTATSCPQAINAGLDMFMAADSWKGIYASTLAQVRSGEIPMARLDDAVRRILRVKFKTGMFEATHSYEGRLDLLGAPDHRALARRAVRESLVLLKNNGGVLPLKASGRVLVAGDGADDIGKQSGGWTISWQGTGNTNADFPHGQSIWSGVREAINAGGGKGELSIDGAFKDRPDVAIVVFGEQPYAEFQGDIPNLEYQPGTKKDLALLKRLKAQGVPVVAVFLSGRPLWTNPEINASDAFVAAWLPGTEGGGVADVLIRKPDGAVNHDFHGKLSYSWPRFAVAPPLHQGDPGYDPLFVYGYGLTYGERGDVAPLAEDSGVVGAAEISRDIFFRGGRTGPSWTLTVSDAGGAATVGSGPAASPRGVVTVKGVDAGAQESGKAVGWNGTGEGAVAITGPTDDMLRQANGDMAVAIRLRVDQAPSGPVALELECGGKVCASLDATRLLKGAPLGEWRTVKVKLSCFRESAADMTHVTGPFALRTSGRFGLSFADVALATNTGDAVCP